MKEYEIKLLKMSGHRYPADRMGVGHVKQEFCDVVSVRKPIYLDYICTGRYTNVCNLIVTTVTTCFIL